MSDEPIAKRTRLSVSLSQNEEITSRKERQRSGREMYKSDMKVYRELSHALTLFSDQLKINRKGLMAQKCIGLCHNKPKCDCKVEHVKLEHFYRKVFDRMKEFQCDIWNTKHFIDQLSIEALHSDNCTESDECLLRMQRMLKRDPLSLERKQIVCIFGPFTADDIKNRRAPLHAAVLNGHKKCVKFLLERGANVTSLTTEGETIIDSVYNGMDGRLDDLDQDRLEVLELLLEYGASSMLKNDKYAAEWALRRTVRKQPVETSLLLQHGAMMGRETSRNAVVIAWESFNLPALKLLLLHHRNRLNFGPGSPVLCPISIQHCYFKMVLAGVPLHLCHEKLLEALQFYKTFGGKFSVCTKKDTNRDLMKFLKSYKHRRHFNDIKSEIKALISTPLSLQEISRLTVRKNIRRNYVESVKYLPLPEALQSFLRFDDVTITELPEKFEEMGDDLNSSSSGEDDDMDL